MGEIRRIFVPSKYGYGRSGAAYIPGNTTLVYEVEMITLDNARGERERKKKEEQKGENKKQSVSRRAILSILSRSDRTI